MNRKQRRETMRKIQSDSLTLEVMHPNARGSISQRIALCASRRIGTANPAHFGCTTPNCERWLLAEAMRDPDGAMQSTGVYWIAVFEMSRKLVSKCTWSMRDTKNLPAEERRQESQC